MGTAPPCAFAKIYKWRDDKGKLHFTDNPSKIPLKYRQEQKIETFEGPPESTDPVKLRVPEPVTKKHVIPLTSIGNGNYIVDVMINGSIPGKFVVDTGASSVTLSEGLGRKVHRNLGSLPKLQVQTGGGMVDSPLLLLRSLKVGSARVENVEANVNPFLGEGFDGLLGMSFLGDFQVRVDSTDDALILDPPGKKGEPTWGGKPGKWWQRRYEAYVSKMLGYRMMAERNKNDYSAANNLRKLSKFYEELYESLDKRAERVDLPEEFRMNPKNMRVQVP
ncbi:aspartyl protease family protein [Nitrospina gracilis]|uniref:aspartyl protease family protein n=1 Tax=Nitrospina gracilis TaxID=35801 RepID=UPI001F3CF997|nr:aspartyl protease family protein [Nitrospina gracilis]MCF8721846.1 clan AA aspartic protease (TIGR02281 family) [Nitrospina gracilis Nb-211]